MAAAAREYLDYNVALMKVAGLWAETPAEGVWALLAWLTVTSCTWLHVLAWLDCGADTDERLRVLVTLLPFVLLPAKVFFTVLLLRRRVRWLVADIRRRCRHMAAIFPEHGRHVFAACDLRVRAMTRRFLGLVFVVMAAFLCKPALHALGVVTEEGVELPLKIHFPLDTSHRPFLGVGLAYLLLVGTVATLQFVLVNIFYVAVVMMLCAQLKVLVAVLESVTEEKLHACVDVHRSILRCGKVLEDLLSPVLLLQFSLSILIVCHILIQIADTPMGLHQYKFVGYLVMMLSELWLYCSFGSQLTDHSEAVAKAAYHCEWLSLPQAHRRKLLLVTLRAQRPLRLVIGKVHVASLNTFAEGNRIPGCGNSALSDGPRSSKHERVPLQIRRPTMRKERAGRVYCRSHSFISHTLTVLKMSYSAFTLVRQLKDD